MRNEIFILSDCCGASLTPASAEHGICPQCGEHCEAVVESFPIEE